MIKEKNRGKINWGDKGIWGLVPIYGKDGGNYTKLISRDRPSIILEKRVHTVLLRLAAFFQKDIRLIRRQAREITGQRSMNPLPINMNIILVPFRMRRPIGRNDGAVGYFSNSSIDNIAKVDKGIELQLKDGRSFHILDSYQTARRHIGNAHQIHYNLLQYDSNTHSSYALCQECNSSYNQPATKGDLATLSQNIGKLVHRLDKLQQ